MPSSEKQQGLVLRRLDYKDRQKILTLFTPERGVISLIVKGLTRKNTHLLTLTSPLTMGEYLFRMHRSTLYTFQDGTTLNSHLFLRQSLPHIEAATQIASALLTSQLPEKGAPSLYKLTLTYLKLLEHVTDPQAVALSFLLKLLKHDGVLSLTSTCALCEQAARALHQGESFCQEHVPYPSVVFSHEEWEMLALLAETRSPEILQKTRIAPPFFHKVVSLFNSFFSKPLNRGL